MVYDKNGNILNLSRNGDREIGNPNLIDLLTYHYKENSNSLLSVNDQATASGFSDGNTSQDDYAYDVNGNLIQDLNKGIVKISYNYLDLPTEVLWSQDKKINY